MDHPTCLYCLGLADHLQFTLLVIHFFIHNNIYDCIKVIDNNYVHVCMCDKNYNQKAINPYQCDES